MGQTICHGRDCIGGAVRAVHGLQQEVGEIPVFKAVRLGPGLGKHQFQFIAPALHDLGSGLGADANPIKSVRGIERAVGFHRNAEPHIVQGINQRFVQL